MGNGEGGKKGKNKNPHFLAPTPPPPPFALFASRPLFSLRELHRPHISIPVQRRDQFLSCLQLAVIKNLLFAHSAFFVFIAEGVFRDLQPTR